MTEEQHKWYWLGYKDAKKREQPNPMMDMPHDKKIAMAYGIQPTKKTTTEEKYLYLNWQDGQNEWFITAAPFKCTKFKFKVETL